MLRGTTLSKCLADLKGRSFYGKAYRIFSPKYLHQPLSTQGAYANGGRYNAPKQMHVLYMAEDPITGLSEARMLIDPSGQMLHRPSTRLVLALDFRLDTVLDLADPTILDALETSFQELTGDWTQDEYHNRPVPTQQLGAACFRNSSFHGIRYPSARNPQRYNFVVFRDRLKKPSYVRVEDPAGVFSGELPGGGTFTPATKR
jgi:RES domain-containing protein